MKILVLTHEFPPVGGGGGRVALDLAAGLARRGHDIRVLTAHLEGLSPVETVEGVQVERIGTSRRAAFRAGFAEMADYDRAAVSSGRKIIREWQPDLLHAHFAVPAGAAAYLLHQLTGIPYVLTIHLGDVPGAVPEKTDHWFRLVYPFTPPIWQNAARAVAVSQFTRELARRYYQTPVEVIHNGVDLAALPPHRPAKNGIPRIVFAGRFVETKNPLHMVEALIRIKNLPWRCAMLGDGPQLEAVRKTVTGAGLEDRVELPGWVTPEQVLDRFAASDILCLPSRAEGLSVVGIQALAMGLAMAVSNAGGNRELVEEGQNGFSVPVGDVDALTGALRRLVEDPALRLACRQKSLLLAEKFSLACAIERYEVLFQSINIKKTNGTAR